MPGISVTEKRKKEEETDKHNICKEEGNGKGIVFTHGGIDCDLASGYGRAWVRGGAGSAAGAEWRRRGAVVLAGCLAAWRGWLGGGRGRLGTGGGLNKEEEEEGEGKKCPCDSRGEKDAWEGGRKEGR